MQFDFRSVPFTPGLQPGGEQWILDMKNRFNGNNILDSSDLRPSCGLVLCSCFFVVCFADESKGTKPRNHTTQESRKDTKGIADESSILLPFGVRITY